MDTAPEYGGSSLDYATGREHEGYSGFKEESSLPCRQNTTPGCRILGKMYSCRQNTVPGAVFLTAG